MVTKIAYVNETRYAIKLRSTSDLGVHQSCTCAGHMSFLILSSVLIPALLCSSSPCPTECVLTKVEILLLLLGSSSMVLSLGAKDNLLCVLVFPSGPTSHSYQISRSDFKLTLPSGPTTLVFLPVGRHLLLPLTPW